MAEGLSRAAILPEPALPDAAALIDEGRRLAATAPVGRSAFLDHYGVARVVDYKRRRAAEGRVMLNAHIGFRDAAKTRGALATIRERVAAAGATPCRRIEDLLAGLAAIARSRP